MFVNICIDVCQVLWCCISNNKACSQKKFSFLPHNSEAATGDI